MPVLVSHSKKSTTKYTDLQTRLLAGLTPQQSVATARWDSNKTTLTKFFKHSINHLTWNLLSNFNEIFCEALGALIIAP